MVWNRLALAVLIALVIRVKDVPVGTAIPIMLDSALDSEKDELAKKIEGRVMQDVLLPSGDKIKERSRILGHVVSVTKPGPSGSSLVVKFDAIRAGDQTISLTTGLLALAGMARVFDAQSPISSMSENFPMTQWITRQVGGDVVNRGLGRVSSNDGVLGTWVGGTSVRIRLTPNPDAGCPGSSDGYDHEQAVWIFSSAACGTYGVSNLKIASAGVMPPTGEIVLTSSRDVAVRGGSGWLLIVAGP
jgi:hypothetical protein